MPTSSENGRENTIFIKLLTSELGYTEEETYQFIEEIKSSLREFMEYTKSEDFLGIIIRAIVYIENDLNKLLNLLLVHPKKINLPFFASKLDAIYALGAIDYAWYGSLNKLNKIRNKYAHDYGYEFKTEDFDELLSTLSGDAKKEYKSNLKNEESCLEIIKIIEAPDYEIDLKYKLRLLISDMMLYIKQSVQFIDCVWADIDSTKKLEFLELRKSKLESFKRTE